MLCPVKDVGGPVTARGNQVWILGTVASAVDLGVVVDALDDLYARLVAAVAAYLCEVQPRGRDAVSNLRLREPLREASLLLTASVIIVLALIEVLVGEGQLHLCDLEVILVLPGCVRAKEDALRREALGGVAVSA